MSVDTEKLVREIVMVANTGVRHVAMIRKVNEEFEALERRWREALRLRFQNYGIAGTSMPREHFNSEGRYATGGPKSMEILICAFKAYQHRVYGVELSIRGVKTFVGLALITDKKTNKVDKELMKRLARGFSQFVV